MSFRNSMGSCFRSPLLITEALVASEGCETSDPEVFSQGCQLASCLQKADCIGIYIQEAQSAHF